MDHRRALSTHQALETFLQTQKVLLERTNADIARLQKRRQHLLEHVHSLPEGEGIEDLGSGLSHLGAAALTFPRGVDWAAFERCDPTPLHALSQSLIQARTQHTVPSNHQRSPLSPLQQLVKDARVRIVDPILSQYPPGTFSDVEEDSDDVQQARARARDPMEERRRLEREKIRELKKRKIHGNFVHEAYGGLSLPKYGGNAGVFVRRDMQDESAEVDVTLDDETDVGGNAMDVDVDVNVAPVQPTYVSGKGYAVKSLPFAEPEPTPAPHARKPKPKVKSSLASHPKPKPKPKPRPPAHAQSSSQRSSSSPPPSPSGSTPARPKSKKPQKPKPETYKQAWSVEEQHHLEQLLEQIPDGEKNRWQKISLAMDGRRTPRQVASRVQKYFEKLKRFGM